MYFRETRSVYREAPKAFTTYTTYTSMKKPLPVQRISRV